MLYEQILSKVKAARTSELARTPMEDGLVIQNSPGHTSKVCRMNRLHNVVGAAKYYADKTVLGLTEEEEGLVILQKIASMQIDKPGDRANGNFLWYAEEDWAQDLNAAFFILMPMLKLRMVAPEHIPPSHEKILNTIKSKGA